MKMSNNQKIRQWGLRNLEKHLMIGHFGGIFASI